MALNPDFVLTALLQHNFLPTQKEAREEIPPCISSSQFTPDVAKGLAKAGNRKSPIYHGYDAVDYKLTRFNGVSRSCSLVHPKAYAELALHIHKHWDKLGYICNNEVSRIRPFEHDDGRIIIMDYEEAFRRNRRELKHSFGKRFVVHTDIANFFPSVYSHAIPWAAVGFKLSKEKKGKAHAAEWFNKLDEKVRHCKRNETQGIAIGPATSNIVSEAILARVDQELQQEFEYTRFIDDYTGYFESEDTAQAFIAKLSSTLARYKLVLNAKKTEIIKLPRPTSADWINELSLSLPKSSTLNSLEATSFLNRAVEIAHKTPDGSVLKYALKTLLSKPMGYFVGRDLLRYALNLAFHHAPLLPLLEKLFETTAYEGKCQFPEELGAVAVEQLKKQHSDAVAWALYLHIRFSVGISDELAKGVVSSGDCIPILMLYLSEHAAHQQLVVDFANGLDKADLYELDEYWILLYQLFLDGKVANPYPDEECFPILKKHNVSFTAKPKPVTPVDLDDLINAEILG